MSRAAERDERGTTVKKVDGAGKLARCVLAMALSMSLSLFAVPAYALEAPAAGGSGEVEAPQPAVPAGDEVSGAVGGEVAGVPEPEPVAPEAGTSEGGTSEDTAPEGVVDPLAKPEVPEVPTTPSDPEMPAPAPAPEGVFALSPGCAPTRVLDVASCSQADGARVQLWRSNKSAAQAFSFVADEDGYVEVVCEGTVKALDVEAGRAEEGTLVNQWTRNGTDAQRWCLVAGPAENTYVLVSLLDPTLVLAVQSGADADGARLVLAKKTDSAAQVFTLYSPNPVVPGGEALTAGIYTLVNPASGKVADIAGGSDTDGAAAQLWERNGSLAQAFSVTPSDEGFYELRSVSSGKLLDADAGSLAPGSRVQQWGRESALNRQWAFKALPEGGYVVVCRANGLVLDVAGGATANGTALQTWSANNTPAQAFMLEPVTELLPEGFWSLRARTGSARALEIAGGSFAQGGGAQIWSWNGTPAQRWRVATYEDGTVSLEALCSGMLLTQSGSKVAQTFAPEGVPAASQRWRVEAAPLGGIALVNVESGQALDVSGAGDWDGCPLGVYEPNGTAAQAFAPSRVDQIAGEGCYEIICAADGRALDVTGASRSNGANVQVWTPNGSGAQKWNVYGAGGGYYVIINARSKKALDVRDYGVEPGTNVQQWAKSGTDAQRWRIEYVGGGSYRLVSACGDLALDIEGAGGWDGANAQTWTPNNTPAQSFRMVPTTYIPEDFTDLIGSFTTYSTNTFNGTYNMQRALNSFNGVIIQPGQTLSFFGTAGPCGAAQGYLPAGIVGGIGYGGGICQASTTLYGASIRTGLTIVQRRNHSVPSTYVPIGLDAMVDYGSSDFKVRNDFDFPVKIVVSTPGNTLTCEMYGIRPEWFDYIEPQSWYTGPSTAAAQRTYYKNGQAIRVDGLPNSYYW